MTPNRKLYGDWRLSRRTVKKPSDWHYVNIDGVPTAVRVGGNVLPIKRGK